MRCQNLWISTTAVISTTFVVLILKNSYRRDPEDNGRGTNWRTKQWQAHDRSDLDLEGSDRTGGNPTPQNFWKFWNRRRWKDAPGPTVPSPGDKVETTPKQGEISRLNDTSTLESGTQKILLLAYGR
jgi:hypothetical protein